MNDLSILIKALLEKESMSTIETQIKNLQKTIDASPIRIKLDINNADLKQLSTNLQQLGKSLNLNSGLDKYTEKFYQGAEQATERIKEFRNKTGQSIKIVEKLDDKTKEWNESLKTVTSNYEKQRQEAEKIQKQEKSVTETINNQIKALQTRVQLLKQNYWTGDMGGVDEFSKKLNASNIDPQNYKTQLSDLRNEWQLIANTTQESHRNNLSNLQKEIQLEEQKSASVMQNWSKQLDIDAKERKNASDRIKDQMQLNAQLDKETDEIQKQIKEYQQKYEIQKRELKTTYGKSYDKVDMSGIDNQVASLYASDFVSVSDFKNKTKEIDIGMRSNVASMKEFRKEATLAMKEADSFVTTLAKDFGKMIAWSVVGTALFGSLRLLKDAVSYVSELDNSLNEIRIVTGQSQEQVEKLAKSYNSLAKQMSVSTKDIASTAVDLYRQGLQGSDVDERMQSIIKYAKISSLSLAESNKIITATMNATGESAQKVIDIFSFLGDATSSGADEIGTAMQKVASMSDGIGVSFEKAASWIAVISSKTREGASQIGTSLNVEAIVA